MTKEKGLRSNPALAFIPESNIASHWQTIQRKKWENSFYSIIIVLQKSQLLYVDF